MTELDILRAEHKVIGEACTWIDTEKDNENTDTLNYVFGAWALGEALIGRINKTKETAADGY